MQHYNFLNERPICKYDYFCTFFLGNIPLNYSPGFLIPVH